MGLFGSIIGSVASIIGGNAQKKAAKKAADAQVNAAQMAIDEQRRQFDTTQQNFAPYLSSGTDALGGITELLGLGGVDAQSSAINGLQSSPAFSSIIQNGENAILQNASATGGLRGGNTIDALSRFRGDTLSSLINSQLSNLGGLANMGMGSAGQLGQFGANAANQIGASLSDQGSARANSYLARGRITANQWQAGADGLESLISSIFGMPGGGGIKL